MKLFETRAGRVLSAANERKLRNASGSIGDALDEIDSVLGQLGDGEDDRNVTTELELRYFDIKELRIDADEEQRKISGYASVFNSLSQVLWGFREQVAPGAFAESIGQDDIRALWNHDTGLVLGRNRAGTLRLWEDNVGLGFEIDPPNTQSGRDAVETIRRGDVDQVSFGFLALDDQWDENEEGEIIRTIKRAKLYEVSPVTFPAYTATTVGVRSDVIDLGAYGRRVDIPAELRRASGSASDAGAEARARAAQRKRQLDLLSI